MFVVVTVLVHLGYFHGLKKCEFDPVTSIVYLDILVDFVAQAFSVPKEKREKIAQLREGILTFKSSVPLKSVQKLMGKRISFSLAFRGAMFPIREMAASTARASKGAKVSLTSAFRGKSNIGVSWMIGTLLSLGDMRGMLRSPSPQMLRFTVGRLLSISSLLINICML